MIYSVSRSLKTIEGKMIYSVSRSLKTIEGKMIYSCVQISLDYRGEDDL